ncbi:MAG: 50S ribosomal protein L25 [Bacteroidia bacterium]
MKTIDLSVVNRGDLGKTGSKALRASDMIPGVVYFNGEATHIAIPSKPLHKVLYSPEVYLINLDVEGAPMQVIVKSADFHPVTDATLHVEFMRVVADKTVIVSLPVKLVGNAVGAVKGGKLLQKLRKIKVRGLVNELPDSIEVDISPLDLGGTILVKEVDFKGIDVVSAASSAIAAVEIPRSLRSTMAGK